LAGREVRRVILRYAQNDRGRGGAARKCGAGSASRRSKTERYYARNDEVRVANKVVLGRRAMGLVGCRGAFGVALAQGLVEDY
jgi:hypothetical protein